MKKIMTVLLALIPFMSMADMNLDLRNQMLDSEIVKCTNVRDEKYEALKQCNEMYNGIAAYAEEGNLCAPYNNFIY